MRDAGQEVLLYAGALPAASSMSLIDAIAEDFVTRYRLGERLSLAEYEDRHPGLAGEIRELFPALVMMEQARSQDTYSASDWTSAENGQHPKQLGEYRVQREARAAARLYHPNIVPIFGIGEADGVNYYAMQLIQGLGLDRIATEVQRLRSERVTMGEMVSGSNVLMKFTQQQN